MADEIRTPKYKVDDQLFFIHEGEIRSEKVTSIQITYGQHGMANILYNFSYNEVMLVPEDRLSDSARGVCRQILDKWKESQKLLF